MYTVDASEAQVLIGYKDIFSSDMPNLKDEIQKLNMHKSISIICELIRVRDAQMNPIQILGGEYIIPFETVLKKTMCGIEPKSPEEMFSNPLMKKSVHIISAQMLLILLKKILKYGNYATMKETDYEITQDDYKKIIQLQLVVVEELNQKHTEKFDADHFLYSTYHLNYQRNLSHEFLRMYYMLEKISRSKANFDTDVQREYRNYYEDFNEKYGFTPTQYSALLFWEVRTYYSDINGLVYEKLWQDIETVYGKTNVKDLVSKVINSLSQIAEKYREWAMESEEQEWDFSKFFEFPFIIDEVGNYISICDITLRNAFFEKVYWMIRSCYPEEDSRAMAFFGRLFERYIQDLAKEAACKDYKYIDEFTYRSQRKEKKSSDAYLRKGTDLLVVEAKGFSVLLECMTRNEKIDKNNAKLFVSPVLQADLCLLMVLGEKLEFQGVEDIYIVSVTMDNINAIPHYFNDIHTTIEAEKKCEKTKYYFNFNIEEYEMLMYLVEKEHNIFSLLRDYFGLFKIKPFSNYILEKYPGVNMTSFMEKIYKEASDNMKKLYFNE